MDGQHEDRTSDNMKPELCDEISQKFRDLASFLNISNDDFIRTTEDRHKKTAQKFWQILEENGFIYKDVYEGWYAIRDEAFYNEDELVDGKAPTGAEIEWHKEESYFFKLSAFGDLLLEFYEKNPRFIEPKSKRNEVISFVKSGLKDLSISRTSFSWGVKVPNDENHVVYVWLDALTNYLSALDFANGGFDYKKFWNGDEENSPIHIVGKDILRFHAIYWPAFLMAAKLPLPKRIYAHGWWTNEGQKISKSVGNIIDPYAEISWLEGNKFQVKTSEGKVEKSLSHNTAIDYLRYFLMREVPFGGDGDYSRDNFVTRINAELANNIGNLAQRSLSMVHKNCDGVLELGAVALEKIKAANLAEIEELGKNIEAAFDRLAFGEVLSRILEFASNSNKKFNDARPWQMKKEGKDEEMKEVLFETLWRLKVAVTYLQPFMPFSASKILDFLGVVVSERDFFGNLHFVENKWVILSPEIVFPTIGLRG